MSAIVFTVKPEPTTHSPERILVMGGEDQYFYAFNDRDDAQRRTGGESELAKAAQAAVEWFDSAEERATPYERGEVLEPMVWDVEDGQSSECFGQVDFKLSTCQTRFTQFTARIVRTSLGSYRLEVHNPNAHTLDVRVSQLALQSTQSLWMAPHTRSASRQKCQGPKVTHSPRTSLLAITSDRRYFLVAGTLRGF